MATDRRIRWPGSGPARTAPDCRSQTHASTPPFTITLPAPPVTTTGVPSRRRPTASELTGPGRTGTGGPRATPVSRWHTWKEPSWPPLTTTGVPSRSVATATAWTPSSWRASATMWSAPSSQRAHRARQGSRTGRPANRPASSASPACRAANSSWLARPTGSSPRSAWA